ncbi:hypothetical protein KP77_07160 [Jeotgalibacillus alimentarius]|uniref:Uncharacterized protein n=1 Tax=Jeotgalibacillus alimentarius TaxID=135826 RepID=A0A0C2SB70_9BACL|nr:hypothetical protein KP77_07160 [Jeotgalibacillus alimentarius]
MSANPEWINPIWKTDDACEDRLVACVIQHFIHLCFQKED